MNIKAVFNSFLRSLYKAGKLIKKIIGRWYLGTWMENTNICRDLQIVFNKLFDPNIGISVINVYIFFMRYKNFYACCSLWV